MHPTVAATRITWWGLTLIRCLQVDFHTTDGTAEAGKDFVATTGTLTFPIGSTKETVAVTLIEVSSRTVARTQNTVALWRPILRGLVSCPPARPPAILHSRSLDS
jgi:hypothetical protein